MRNTYIAITKKDWKKGIVKYYSFVMKLSEIENIKNALRDPRIIAANIYTIKRKAEEVVKWWNDGYRKNGNYFFDNWQG